MQTTYFSGPEFLSSSYLPGMSREDLTVIIPNPLSFQKATGESEVSAYPSTSFSESDESHPLISPERVSSF